MLQALLRPSAAPLLQSSAPVEMGLRCRAWRLALTLAALIFPSVAVAHNVGQSQTTKFFAPETVQMLTDRANGVLPGGPGLRNGDIIYYVIESVPSPNGATLGSAGYITDYVPPGTQVVQASFVHKVPDPTQPGGFGFIDAPMGSPGMMPDGTGAQFNNTFAGSGGMLSAGSLARATQDTGIFFSSDPRTARLAAPMAFTPQGLRVASVVNNQWDVDQGTAFTGRTNVFSQPSSRRGVTPVLDCLLSGAICGPGSLFVGLGSPVAGPDVYYTNDYNPLLGGVGLAPAYINVGPWHRISYPGSLIGGSGPVTAFGTPGAAARIIGTDTITGVPTSAGWALSTANPLPYDPTLSSNPGVGPAVTPGLIGTHANAVRWAIGERSVGTVEHVKIGLKIIDLALFGALTNPTHPAYTNVSDVFGGDASGSQKAIDSVWVYLAPTEANHNAQVNLLKEVVAVGPTATGPWTASDGSFLTLGQFVKYRINYLNANAAPLHNVVITDTIDTVNATYVAASATTGNPFIGTATYVAPTVSWPAIAVMSPGGGGYVELVVQINAAAAGTITSNGSNLTATEVPAPGASSMAVSALSASGLPPQFVVNKTVTPTQVAPGGATTYTITIENTGGALAFPLLGGGTPVHPIGGGVAPNPWLVIGDQLPLNGAAAGMTAGAETITLTDTTTGIVYPLTLTTDYTVPVAPAGAVGAVFYSINTYPAGHPKAGLPFDFVNSRITITLPVTVSATMLPGVYYNTVECFYGLDQTLFAGGFGAGSDGAKSFSYLAPVSINAPDFSTLPLTASDLNGGVPAPGDTIRYSLNITNNGVAAGTTVTAILPVPPNAPFVVGSVVATGATVSYDNGSGLYTYVPGAGPTDPNVKTIKVIYPSVAVAAAVMPTYDVQIPTTASNGLQLTVQASLTSVETGLTTFRSDDPTLPGQLDPTVVTVVAAPDFSTSTKTVLVNGVAATAIHAGDTLTYTITVTDTGNEPGGATNVTVTDFVDLTTLQNVTLGTVPAGWVASGPDANGKIVWYTLNLAQGGSATLSFTATVQSGLAQGTNVDNTADVTSSETPLVSVVAPTLTIPITQVSGTLFNDGNGNGVQDAGEGGIANVTVALRVPGFVTDIVTTTTNAAGGYTLTAPLSGNWDVVVSDTGGVLTGWSPTTANQPLNITLNNGQVAAGQDFGYQLTTPPATVRGRIFDDLDGSGTQNGAETGLTGVTLALRTGSGALLATATTNALGDYNFGNLAGGNYTLEITDTGGLLVNRYLTSATPAPVSIVGLSGGATVVTDFGYRLGSTLGDLVYDDADASGTYTVGDSGIAGITVELRPAGGGVGSAIATTTTGAFGGYSFKGVAPGNYDVVVTDAAAILTPFTPATPVTLAATATSGIDVLTLDFPFNSAPAITVTKTVDRGTVGFNEGMQFTITVTNTGGTARSFSLKDVLPSTTATAPYTVSSCNFQYIRTDSVTLNGVSFSIPSLPTSFSFTPTWSGFDLPAASTLIVKFTAFSGANAGLNYNGVQVSYAPTGVPPLTLIDFANLTTVTVSDLGNVSLAVTAVNGVAVPAGTTPTVVGGDVVSYRLTLANTPAALSQTVQAISATLPVGFNLQVGSSTLTSSNYLAGTALIGTQVGQLVTWTLPATLPMTAAAYPDTLWLDFKQVVPTGVSGTFTTKGVMSIGTVAPGTAIDTGNAAPVVVTLYQIGDLVFKDVNGNGVFDVGTDQPASGVSVELRPQGGGAGTALASTSTNASGNYGFQVSNPGTYSVVVTDTGGILLGHSSTTGGPVQNVTVGGGVLSILTADFGYLPPALAATINGTVFDDTSGNGILDGLEIGIAGVTVEIRNLFNTPIATATTNAAGLYSFTGIPGGMYQVLVTTPPAGRTATTAQPLSITVADGATSNGNDLGYQLPGTVTGRVFADVDNSGSFTAGDVWMSGVTVWLKDVATTIATVTTDATGTYTFANIAMAGGATRNLTVDIDNAGAPISGATLTFGTDPTAVVATSGSTINAGDAGYWLQGRIAGSIYNDLNGNGLFDGSPTDGLLTGVTVNLMQGATTLATVSSDAAGAYQFVGLAPGSYTVQTVTPTGYLASAPVVVAPATQPEIAITLAGGQQVTGQNFGFVQPPNLSVSKTTAAPFAGRGSTVVYTVTITNSGGPASNVVVTDYLPDIAVPAGWPVAPAVQPTLSPGTMVFPAVVAPQVTTATLNGVATAFTETPGVGTIVWSTAAGGFVLGNGDTLSITFAVDAPNVEGSYYNSLGVAYGAAPATALWYPDANLINVTRTYDITKQVIAVNGVAWAGGIPTIDVGDTVTYEVTVTNFRGTGRVNRDELFVATLNDTLPLGFKYLPGTSQALSPGNNVLVLTPVLDPVVTAATATTPELLAYIFNGGVIPNRGALPVVGDSMVTGSAFGDTATLRFDAVAYDAVTPHQPLSGNNDNNVTTMADRLRGAGVTLSYKGATVNVSTRAKIQGFVFKNLDGNTTYNPPTDTPFNGVTVELQPSGGGAATAVATTDTTGAYTLIAPAGGSYTVVVTDTGAVLTGTSNTIAPALPIAILDGQTLTGQNWGYVVNGTPGTLSGTIFDDLNGDGVMQAPGEAGLAGAVVQLKATGGTVLATVTTVAGGAYAFPNLAAGNYVVTVDRTSLPTRYSTPAATPVAPATVAVVGGAATTQDLGWAVGATFSGFVFEDADNNAVRGAAAPNLEPGRSGVTLQLVDTATNTVMETVTTATMPVAPATTPVLGSYSFAAVPAGTYRIDVTDTAGRLTGYALTTANQPMTAVTVAAGAATVSDFGYFLAPAITVTKTMASTSIDRGAKMDATITVTNSGGAAVNVSVADVLPAAAPVSPFGGAGLFTASLVPYVFDLTQSITLDGVALTAGVDYTAPVALSATPTWSGIALPGGSILVIHLTAAQPAAARLTGSPNYNGVSIQYGGAAPFTVSDYPDLVMFSTARDAGFVKRLVAVNGVVVSGSPTIAPGDTLTFELAVTNTLNGTVNTVTGFGDTLPADLAGAGLTYVVGSSKLTDPTLGTALAPIVDPVVTAGVVGSGIAQTLAWTVANPATLATFPSEVVLRFDALVSAAITPGSYTNSGSGIGSNRRGAYTLYGSVAFGVQYLAPLLTAAKTVDLLTANSGQVVTYTTTITNTGAGPATSVVASFALDPFVDFVVGSITFSDGPALTPAQGASALTLGTVTYFNGGGTPITPTGAAGAADPAIRSFQVNLTGTMNGGVAPTPAFALSYQGQVQ